LIKILDNNPALELPSLFKSIGKAPKNAVSMLGSADEITGDEEDFIDDTEVEIADEDELEGLNTDTEGADESEEDDFADEFSDNDGFDDEDVEKD
jgi:hypothetical protein